MSDEPKIIVDDDWKKQARAEKAKLAEAEKANQAKAPPAGARPPGATPGKAPAGAGPGPGPGEEAEPPYNIDFPELMRMLGTQALMYLGQFPDPQTGKAIIALDMAKVHIDMLGVLEEKTKGNLTPDEDRDLKGLLGELRMIFVEISKGVAKAMAEGRIGPKGELRGGPGGMGGGMGGPMGGAGGFSGPLPGPMSGPGFDPSAPGSFPIA